MKKKKKIDYQALILDGRLTTSRSAQDEVFRYLGDWEGEQAKVTIEIGCSRSNAQNAFFHGCIMRAVQRILTQKGMSGAEDAEFVKEVILKKPYLTVNHGTPNEYIRPTSSLDVEDFWEFCNYCIELIVRLGGNLSDREQMEYQKIITQFHLDKAVDESFSRD